MLLFALLHLLKHRIEQRAWRIKMVQNAKMETKAGLRRELRLVCVFGTAARISAFQIMLHALPTSLSLSQPLLPFNPLFQAFSSKHVLHQCADGKNKPLPHSQFRIEIYTHFCHRRTRFFFFWSNFLF